ncbi:MAG TPA: glycosyl hydrolase, partial [Pseudoduganella sp.]
MKHNAAILLALAAFPCLAMAADPARPWLDSSLDPDRRAMLVLKEMTQKEKLNWVSSHFGADHGGNKTRKVPEAIPFSAGYVPPLPRLGLPALFLTDAGIGVATQNT